MNEPRGARVLVVDDNAAGRYVTVRTLQAGGHRVQEVGSGHEALHAAREVPDLIVLDVNLPDLSGMEVARQLREAPETVHVPVLMVSAARLADADRVQGLQGGADAYLTHPVEPGVLLATVQALLRVRMAEAELRQFNRELESKVAARTAELAERNAALEANAAELAQQTARLTQANADLEAFAYSVSHDLRSPVRHVSSFAGLLRRRLGAHTDGQALKYLDTIERSARGMDALIEGLLAFSRFGLQDMQVAQVDLDALAHEVQAQLAVDAEGRHVEWALGPLPVVPGDTRLLWLVLMNLLDNALKYTRTRHAPLIEVWAEERPDEWAMFVRDNGVGFDPRYAQRLFGVFQRLHRADEFEGTGVGLANVRRIVSRHGGQVSAHSERGEGATFGFTLPKPP